MWWLVQLDELIDALAEAGHGDLECAAVYPLRGDLCELKAWNP